MYHCEWQKRILTADSTFGMLVIETLGLDLTTGTKPELDVTRCVANHWLLRYIDACNTTARSACRSVFDQGKSS